MNFEPRTQNLKPLAMILEKAILDIKPGHETEFERDFKKASGIISSMKGYITHSLHKCIELENRYLLLVQWQTLEDHEIGFRKSSEYGQWKELLHHYYDPFPKVEHYQKVL